MKLTFHGITSLPVASLRFGVRSPQYLQDRLPKGKDASAASPVVHVTDADGMRVAGEQRFRANCARCHAAPQKFPPRMMGTILRHMRVRATITSEDQRLILFYMTQ